MSEFINIHSHQTESSASSIINCYPAEIEQFVQQHPTQMCSVGLHPWHINEQYEQELEIVARFAFSPQVVAIGEAGLDKLTETPFPLQQAVFLQQTAIAEKVQKPLIIHCVKAYSKIIQLKKELNPQSTWIIHGFRGKASIAQELIQHDFCLSFGKGLIYLENTICSVPLEKVFLETDDSPNDIEQVYETFSKTRPVSMEILKDQVNKNFEEIFQNRILC
ncbi:MAG: TatD family hydrolase [Paludibacteraceae bacterium]|nr:TatD family hydrolase [Paludibacteraceae bacterium]